MRRIIITFILQTTFGLLSLLPALFVTELQTIECNAQLLEFLWCSNEEGFRKYNFQCFTLRNPTQSRTFGVFKQEVSTTAETATLRCHLRREKLETIGSSDSKLDHSSGEESEGLLMTNAVVWVTRDITNADNFDLNKLSAPQSSPFLLRWIFYFQTHPHLILYGRCLVEGKGTIEIQSCRSSCHKKQFVALTSSFKLSFG